MTLQGRAALVVGGRGGIGSYDGFVADPGLAAYCATKGPYATSTPSGATAPRTTSPTS